MNLITKTLVEKEIVKLQEALHALDKKGCEHCGFIGTEAMENIRLEQELSVKLRAYEEILSSED